MSAINFGSKQCERIRAQLDAYLSNELLVETTGEVAKHLGSCEACSRELEARVKVREALRRAVKPQVPPERLSVAVRTRLRERPARYFWPAPTRWAVALAGLAFLVFVGVLGQQWLEFRTARRLVASVLTLGVSDHLHCAIKGHNYPDVASSSDQLRRKLGPQYAGLLPIVEEKLSGFQVLEAHLCSVPGSPRKYVHFIARGQGTIVSVILTRREGESLPAGRFLIARTAEGVELYKARMQGMNVAGFQTKDYLGFVVSGLSQEEMVRLASTLAPALRGALDRSAQVSERPQLFASLDRGF